MAKIKIISNPYQKLTRLEKYNLVNDCWDEISYENSSNSVLVSDDIKKSFFQFKADEIVEGIYSDYHNADEKIRIIFEGTEDDFVVLEKICNQATYVDSIVLERSERYLENAAVVLPTVKKIFSQVEPLVEYCVMDKENVRREMKKFTEASDDCIPVVVLGNYSAGKSTFINALIGSEILPSGDEPVTAKIYKISKSESDDRASISFCFHDTEKVQVNFTTKKNEIKCDNENVIVQLLKEGLNTVKSKNILIRLSKALAVVNSYENDTVDQEISDLIEVTTPFHNGILSDSESKYVIFDTPGSNSASNTRHLEVLKRAMEDMSNGIPMFISEFDSLDSTDNETLYTQINEMSELDSRFTMIVVNKADNARLDPDGFNIAKIKNILNWSIPKNLYSEGIYFVSSIMGLGAKNNGKFQDEYYDDIFCAQEERYKNPKSRHKKSLYKYNIMPAQLKESMTTQTESIKNLIYANSGIYSVELGLEAFASNYSSYNKCEQSRLFLNRIIEITEEVIKERVTKSKRDKENMLQTLEKEKAELLKAIDLKSDELTITFNNKYTDYIEEYIQNSYTFITSDDLKNQEKHIELKYQDELKLEEVDARVTDSKSKMVNSFKIGINRDANMRNAARLGRNFIEGFKDWQEQKEELKKTNKDIDGKVSDEIIETNKMNFEAYAKAQKNLIDNESRMKWADNANRVRRELSQIISGTSALTSDQRDELTKIIIEYGDIDFDTKADEIFIKDDFLYGIRFGNIVIGDSDKLRLNKLRKVLNQELTKYIHNVCKQIQNSHQTSFRTWLNALLSDVRENITEYSSLLHTQLDYIKQEEEFINDFESKQQMIKNYSNEVDEMISWRE